VAGEIVNALSEKAEVSKITTMVEQHERRLKLKGELRSLYFECEAPGYFLSDAHLNELFEPVCMTAQTQRYHMMCNTTVPQRIKFISTKIQARGRTVEHPEHDTGRGDWMQEGYEVLYPEHERPRLGKMVHQAENELKSVRVQMDNSGRFSASYSNYTSKIARGEVDVHNFAVISPRQTRFLEMTADKFAPHANGKDSLKYTSAKVTYHEGDDLLEKVEDAADEIVAKCRDFGWCLAGTLNHARMRSNMRALVYEPEEQDRDVRPFVEDEDAPPVETPVEGGAGGAASSAGVTA
jgi:hypothetical protein